MGNYETASEKTLVTVNQPDTLAMHLVETGKALSEILYNIANIKRTLTGSESSAEKMSEANCMMEEARMNNAKAAKILREILDLSSLLN